MTRREVKKTTRTFELTASRLANKMGFHGYTFTTGSTGSTNFPTTNPYQAALAGGTDAFLAKVNTTGAVSASTYLGGSSDDVARAVAVDSAGQPTIVGQTASSNFPTVGVFGSTLSGSSDAFVTRFTAGLATVDFSSYLGGSGSDSGSAVAVDNNGYAFVTGSTNSTNFPTVIPIQGTNGGGTDAFITKIRLFNNLPVVVNPGSQTTAEGTAVSLQIQASDPDGDTLYYGSSNLPDGVTIDAETGLISGAPSYSAAETMSGVYAVTITVYDSNGASSSQSFTWTVTNTNTPPVLANPGDQINSENDGVSLGLGGLGVTQPDNDPLTWTASGLPSGLNINSAGTITGVISSSAAANSPYSVTVTASDGTYSSSQTFSWVVQRVRIDSVEGFENLEGDTVSEPINAWEPSGGTLTYSASGLPSGLSIDSSTGIISGTIGSSASGSSPYNVSVTASDGSSSASTSFTWTVDHVQVTQPDDQTNAEGDQVSLPINAAISSSQTLTFSATGLPNGLSIDSSTGIISGTVANLDSNSSPYSVTVTASDGSQSANQTFVWTITHVLLTNPGDQINAQGGAASLQLQGTDPDNDALTYSATSLPSGLSINASTGLISGTLSGTAGANSPSSVTVSASDGTHTASQSFIWTVTNAAVTVTNPGSKSNAEGDTVSLQVVATDPNNNPLTYSAVGLPLGLQIDSDSGLISGTIDSSAAETSGGIYPVTVLADNGVGGSGSQTFTWTVSHTNQAPELSGQDPVVNVNGDVVSLSIGASDPDGDTLSYSASGLPSGLTMDSSSGIISGTISGSASASSPYSVTVTASDGTLSSSESFPWIVTSGTVTVTAPADQTNAEGDSVSVSVSASSSSGPPFTFSATDLPPGLSINSSTGLITGSIANNATQISDSFDVTITAVDSLGNGGTADFVWNVNHVVQPPTLTNPGNQSVAEGNSVTLQLQAVDPDDNFLEYSASGLPAGLTIDLDTGIISGEISYTAAESGSGHYTTQLAVNDGDGHTVSQSFTWTVTDTNRAPWVAYPGLQNNQTGDSVTLPLVSGDPDGDTLSFSASNLPSGLSINSSSGLISGIITASPGNYSASVTVSDGQTQYTQAFVWQVSASRVGQVAITLNGTPDATPNVAVLGSSDPDTAKVTLLHASPGLHRVVLSVPSGRSSLSQSSFLMPSGGTVTIGITALTSSVVDDDVVIDAEEDGARAGDACMANVTVTFGKVRAADTPTGMKDRIPPWKPTPVEITLSVPLAAGEHVFLNIGGKNAINGTAVFLSSDGGTCACLYVDESKTFQIQGRIQTDPGHDSQLYVTTVGAVGGGVKSTVFSVAAIPIKSRMYNPSLLAGREISKPTDEDYMFVWGTFWNNEIVSDSGDLRDLDKVECSEKLVDAEKPTGVLKDIAENVGDFEVVVNWSDTNSINLFAPKKVNGVPVPEADARTNAVKDYQRQIRVKGNGTSNELQYDVFIDYRTGYTNKARPLIVAKSGFRLVEKVGRDGDKYLFRVKRTAEANNGAEKGLICPYDTDEMSDEFK